MCIWPNSCRPGPEGEKGRKKGQNLILLETGGREKHENHINLTRKMVWFHGWLKLWPVGSIWSNMHLHRNRSEETHAGYVNGLILWHGRPVPPVPAGKRSPRSMMLLKFHRSQFGCILSLEKSWSGLEKDFFFTLRLSVASICFAFYVNFNDCHSCYDNQILGHVGQPRRNLCWVIHLQSCRRCRSSTCRLPRFSSRTFAYGIVSLHTVWNFVYCNGNYNSTSSLTRHGKWKMELLPLTHPAKYEAHSVHSFGGKSPMWTSGF